MQKTKNNPDLTLKKQMLEIKKHIKKLKGVVVSDKMTGTIVVEVTRLKEHKKYKRRFKISKRYKVNNPKNEYKVGDGVIIEECRPLSKEKRWRVVGKLK